jgi:hypothetical protein
LPESLEVEGDLVIIGAAKLRWLPARLQIKGSLRLVGVPVDRLPEYLRVGGDLTLDCCSRLTELPEGLEIGGSLFIRRCPFRRLSPALRVGRDLRVQSIRELKDTPEGLSAPGSIELADCGNLVRIGPGLRVGRNLIVRRCPSLEELPAGLRVPGRLDLRGCTRLEHLPGGIQVGFSPGLPPHEAVLRLAGSLALHSLPEDIEIGGPIEVADSGLKDLPERLFSTTRFLWRSVVVPPEVIFRPESLTSDAILFESNAELRRVMLERVGLERVLAQAKAVIRDCDRDAGGARRLVHLRVHSRPRTYLQCVCPSTGREYLLRVPPNVQTCRQAAAWLAGFSNPDAYRPIVET